MELSAIIVIILVLIVPWVILYIYQVSSNSKTLKIYRKLEEKYGLKPDFSKKVGFKNHPAASGAYRSRNVRIESLIRDSLEGKKVMPHTSLIVECLNTYNLSFEVVRRKRQNIPAFQNGSVLLNDNEFDDKFIVRSNNPEKLKNLFDFNTKFKLDQVHSLGFDGMIKLEGNHLTYTEKGLLNNETALMRLELVMHELCDIADVMRYN